MNTSVWDTPRREIAQYFKLLNTGFDKIVGQSRD